MGAKTMDSAFFALKAAVIFVVHSNLVRQFLHLTICPFSESSEYSPGFTGIIRIIIR